MSEDLLIVDPIFGEQPSQRPKRPLATLAIIDLVLVTFLKGQVLLVNAVIGQVHKLGALALLVRAVLAGRKPHQAFLIDVDAQWVYTGD